MRKTYPSWAWIAPRFFDEGATAFCFAYSDVCNHFSLAVDLYKKGISMATVQTTTRKPLLSEMYVPQTMPSILGTFDMTAIFIMGVFWVSNVTGVAIGGAVGFTYWILCGLTFFIPCVIVTAQLGILYPYEGSLYNWTYRAFGGFMSFFVTLCAWLPGLLSIVSAAFVVVNCLQALNAHWLQSAWQQGLVICAIVVFSAVLAVQRFRMVQHIVNVVALATLLATLFIGLAAVAWLLTGHQSATNFAAPSGWMISLAPQTTNASLLGTVTLALLGATIPLQMAGELATRRAVTRHLLWGALLVLAGYLVLTFAVLTVEGQSAALNATNPISLLIDTVDKGLGRFAGSVTAICLTLFFVVVAAFENYAYARLLMVAAIDRRLPLVMGKLNRNRVPANAVWYQTGFSLIYTAAVFFVTPLIATPGNADILPFEAYSVTAASLLLVWAFSFLFPFADLLVLYVRDRRTLHAGRLFPLPFLLVLCVVGPLVCVLTIVITLIYSWVPALIDNGHWGYIVGGILVLCLLCCGIGSLFANSEAGWEEMQV